MDRPKKGSGCGKGGGPGPTSQKKMTEVGSGHSQNEKQQETAVARQRSTAAAPSAPSAQVVGNAFVQQYYHILHLKSELVHRFYQDSSFLSRPDVNGNMTTVTTMKAINEKILLLNYEDHRAEVETTDAQDSYEKGVIVLVTGCSIAKDNVRKKFTQTFFLAPQDNGYFVFSDVFRYIGNSKSQINSVPANGINENTSASALAPGPATTDWEPSSGHCNTPQARSYDLLAESSFPPLAATSNHSQQKSRNPTAAMEHGGRKSYSKRNATLQERSTAAAPSAQVVGNAFVQQYYHILHQKPELVHRFYQDSSSLSRPDVNGNMKTVTTMKAINEKILSLHYEDHSAEIETADAQDLYEKRVSVLVTGCLISKNNVRKKFTQSFFLAPQDNRYFVFSDVFRYIGDSRSRINSLPANSINENTSTSALAPEPVRKATEDDCIVCADTLKWVAYGPCGHKEVCSTCVIRLRLVCKDRRCCLCKCESNIIFVTRALGDYTKVINDFTAFPDDPPEGQVGPYWYHEGTQAFFDDLDQYKMTKAMCMLSCAVCQKDEQRTAGSKRQGEFKNFEQLKSHLLKRHELLLCSLCLEGRKVFICEQKLYSKAQLIQHIRTGESTVDGNESERGGFAGHPLCEFCQNPFYGDNELYLHMSTEHYTCHICQRQHPEKHEYYRNYDDMEIHFRQEHFLCEDKDCLSKKFVVFSTNSELKRHTATEHGGRKSHSKRNATLQIPQ